MAEESLDEVYERHVRPLSAAEQLRLVERIARELASESEREAAAQAGAEPEGEPRVAALLEDEAERAEAMAAALRERAPDLEVVVFDNAPDMIAWLPGHVAAMALASLDHDLGPNRQRDGRTFDPATGRVVASVLASLTPSCPIIIHCSNYDAALGIKFCLQDAGWTAERVVPADDRAWIATEWIDTALALLGRGEAAEDEA